MSDETLSCWERWGREAADFLVSESMEPKGMPPVQIWASVRACASWMLRTTKEDDHAVLRLRFAREIEALRWTMEHCGMGHKTAEKKALDLLVRNFRQRLTEIAEGKS
ncbi:MAG: hypothetical protein HY369_00540 [Candidatus Aenigmarchaeota archaeon]|nr:hypothetical protein [Candidatus Aenigmarchaeota archaeon]